MPKITKNAIKHKICQMIRILLLGDDDDNDDDEDDDDDTTGP